MMKSHAGANLDVSGRLPVLVRFGGSRADVIGPSSSGLVPDAVMTVSPEINTKNPSLYEYIQYALFNLNIMLQIFLEI